MSDETPVRPERKISPLQTSRPAAPERIVCERCGAEMYRMHAVWRCAACGFKTDCCGW
jgi:ribosomal protein L37E